MTSGLLLEVKLEAEEGGNLLFSAAVGAASAAAGLLAAKAHPALPPLAMALAIYPEYLLALKEGRNWSAAARALAWALGATVAVIAATAYFGEGVGRLVLNGPEYKEEMFKWIKTGVGAEGDPRLFVKPKLVELAVFSLLSAVSAGFLGLLLGAYLLNYMNYYVGCLFIHAKPGYTLTVALAGWPVYAVIRVVGYVCLGTVLSTPLAAKLLKAKFSGRSLRRQLTVAAAAIILDFILKATVANAVYQPILKKALGL